MKRILFIAPFESPHIFRWFKYFDEDESIDSHLLICYHLIDNRNLWTKILSVLTLKQKIIKVIDSLNPDIVNLHTLLFPNYLLTKSIKKKVVITPWNGDVIWHKYGKELFILRHIKIVAKKIKEVQIKKSLNNADLVTCNSQEMETRVLSLLEKDVPIARIQIPGIYSSLFIKLNEKDKKDTRTKLNLPADPYIILSPRSLDHFYNIDIIISAFNLALKKDNNLFLIIKYFASNKLPEFQEMIMNLGIQDHVVFVGQIDYEEVLEYYQVSDLCISISSKDSIPQSAIESLSCETPVIGGDIPPMHEIIVDGISGFIVPCRDEHILAEKIIYCKNNQMQLKEFARIGRETVIQKHDHLQNMKRMAELFESL
jgi:glycosyltransferase involved in cell wall biosynthesis